MVKLQHFNISIDNNRICCVELDVSEKSVNVLTQEVMKNISKLLEWIENHSEIEGLGFLSGKPGGFIYGADIAEFEFYKTTKDVLNHMQFVHALFNRLERLSIPTAVGIDGIAVGGGLEIALTFDYIIATNNTKTKLGFPEVNLGILPGYGGSGRAYSRVGTSAVAEMMVSGKPVTADAALTMGLVDQIVNKEKDLKPAISAWLAEQVNSKPKRKQVEITADINALVGLKEQALGRLRCDHTPAPFAIIEHIKRHGHDAVAMSAGEMDVFPDLMISETSKNLRRVYYLTDKVRKTARGDSSIKNLHVVGAGVMGGDIAAVAAMSGLTVTLTDIRDEVIKSAINRAEGLFEKRLKNDHKVLEAKNRLKADPKGDGAKNADLIIEAVSEKLSIKQDVFRALQSVIKPSTILATNTSAIPLEDIATALNNPAQLIGLHFFNPVPVLPLVEVIWSNQSDQSYIQRGMQFVGQIKKMPIRCKSSLGFLVNRALLPYMFGAIEAFENGMNADKIDQALVDFGMPMGPIELCDQVGLDVCLDVGMVLGMASPVEKILRIKNHENKLGRKTGEGFYKWNGNRSIRPREKVEPLLSTEIVNQMLAPMIEQCKKAVKEGVVESADEADAGMIFGTGFPGFRGGPLCWANKNTPEN